MKARASHAHRVKLETSRQVRLIIAHRFSGGIEDQLQSRQGRLKGRMVSRPWRDSNFFSTLPPLKRWAISILSLRTKPGPPTLNLAPMWQPRSSFLMTRRYRQRADGRRMAVGALKRFRLVPAGELLCKIIRVTCRASHDRHIGVFQSSKISIT